MIVTRRYPSLGFSVVKAQDVVDPSVAFVDLHPDYVDVQVDDAAYDGVLDTLDEFMLQQGFGAVSAAPEDVTPRRLVRRQTSVSIAVDVQDEFVGITAAIAGPIVLSLPPAVDAQGKLLVVKDVGGNVGVVNTVTIDADGADAIDGAGSVVMSAARSGTTLVCDGSSSWSVVSVI